MFIILFDRYMNSECGFKCGYLLENPVQYFNPLDHLLRRLSSKHEFIINMDLFLDTILFMLISVYCLICIFYSICKIGINFFSYEIFKVKRRETLPQALSITSVLVVLMMFAFSMQIMTIAPKYTMFGDQRVDKQSMEKCTLKNGKSMHTKGTDEEKQGAWGLNFEEGFGCQMSMISQLYNKME